MTQNLKEACEKYAKDNNIPGEYAAYDLERFVEVFTYDKDEYEEGYSFGHDAGYDEGCNDTVDSMSRQINNIINKCVSFDELKEELLAFIDE